MLRYFVVVVLVSTTIASSDPSWSFTCKNGHCERQMSGAAGSTERAISMAECKLTCSGDGMLWPLPSGPMTLAKTVKPIDIAQLSEQIEAPNAAKELMNSAIVVFKQRLGLTNNNNNAQAAGTSLHLSVEIKSDEVRLTLHTIESYELTIETQVNGSVHASITSPTFFGARHALETLHQLMYKDEDTASWFIIESASIKDAPSYPYRAITLDTSRNFITVQALKRTIDTLSRNKMNTLHWHVVDSHSFPLVIPDEPRFTQYGAYSNRQVYSEKDVDDLIKYSRVRGIRLLPEFDSPAHVGFGWQWGEGEEIGKLAACVNREPWSQYCVEPPCGQLNIANKNIYGPIRKILSYFYNKFNPDMLHIGGDEVNINCWKSDEEITQYLTELGKDPSKAETYMEEWRDFNTEMLNMWHNITKRADKLIVWTSELTKLEDEISHLSPENYIVQVWTKGDSPEICDLMSRGYKLIMSNYDALYLDCGFSSWVSTGNNWCSPFKSWQTVYDNNIGGIADRCAGTISDLSEYSPNRSPFRNSIVGASAALWSEQNDDHSLDNKLWPRVSALAEKLWSDPRTSSVEASDRYTYHRYRMTLHGVNAETVQPFYCLQYGGHCKV